MSLLFYETNRRTCRSLIREIVIFISVLVPSSRAVADIVFNASADYSSTNNPNGVWSAGVRPSLNDSTLLLFDINTWSSPGFNGLNSWNLSSNPNDAPGFAKNFGPDVIQGIAPGQLLLHPGNQPGVDELATLRFTAPWTGDYALSSQFFDGNIGETTGHVYLNGIGLFSSLTSANPVFNTTLNLVAGDQVDFIVDSFTDSYVADATGLSVNFSTTAVPEPSSFILMTTCVGGFLVNLRKRASA